MPFNAIDLGQVPIQVGFSSLLLCGLFVSLFVIHICLSVVVLSVTVVSRNISIMTATNWEPTQVGAKYSWKTFVKTIMIAKAHFSHIRPSVLSKELVER